MSAGQWEPLTAGWSSSQTQPSGEGAECCCIRLLMCPKPWPSPLYSIITDGVAYGNATTGLCRDSVSLNCLIPYLLGASLCLSCEKLLCSEEDHRLRLYTLTFTRCVRGACATFPCCLCWGAAPSEQVQYPETENESRKNASGCQCFVRKFLFLLVHEGLTHRLSQMAVRLSVTMIKLSLIPAGEA